MKIFINSIEIDISTESDELLGRLLMRLEDHLHLKNLHPTDLTVDDQEIPDDNPESFHQRPVGDFSTLNIEAIPYTKLAENTFLELRPLLSELKNVIQETAEMFQGGKTVEAKGNIDSILQVWAVLFETITGTLKLHDFELKDILLNGKNLGEMIFELSNNLKEIEKSYENQDYVTLADILEYEMAEKIPTWLEAIDILINLLKHPSDEPTG